MMRAKSGRVRVDSRQFLVSDLFIDGIDALEVQPEPITNNLIAVSTRPARVITGVHTGTVTVTWKNVDALVNCRDAAAHWDLIAEFSITSDGTLQFTPISGEPDTIGPLLDSAAHLRVLMRVANRFADYDDVNEHSAEAYEFTAWPQPQAELRVHLDPSGALAPSPPNSPLPPSSVHADEPQRGPSMRSKSPHAEAARDDKRCR